MGYTYRNRNTDDEVTYPRRSARLDHLPNWELVSQPPPTPAPAVVEENKENGPGQASPDSGRQQEEDSVPSPLPERPAGNAKQTVWAAYLVAVDPRISEETAAGMTREELVAAADEAVRVRSEAQQEE